MFHCVLNNTGSDGDVAQVSGSRCHWRKTEIIGSGKGSGLVAENSSTIRLESCALLGNRVHGVQLLGGLTIKFRDCRFEKNFGTCISL